MGIERHHTDKLGNPFTVRPVDLRKNIALRPAVISLFKPLWEDSEDDLVYISSIMKLNEQEGLGAFQEHEPRLIGASFVDFHPQEQQHYDFESAEGVARLVNFAVHPAYHRKKIGAALLADTVGFAREHGAQVLRITPLDEASAAFYIAQRAAPVYNTLGDEYLQIDLTSC